MEMGPILEAFLADVVTDTRVASPATWDWYRKRVRQFFEWLEGRASADPFTPAVFRRYIASLKERNLSPYTLRGHINILHHLGRWLAEKGYAHVDPAASLKPPRLPQTLPKAASPADIERVVAAAQSEGVRSLAVVLFLRDTGVRAMELVGLRWRNVDLDRRVAYVVGKGKKARFVFFTEATAEVLRELAGQVPSGPDDSVFWGNRRPLSVQALSRLLIRLGKSARTAGPINPHAWRHAFGRDMTRNGCPTLALQALMGHSTPAVTMIYSRLDTGELQKVYNRYAAWEEASSE